ncbi:hypothetical protein ABIA22_000380 [Sinorhizobium fredii]|uniref:hypothetical protein n=1 Tax=Rhizobium fredii TaxID=380 RepID=UPI0035112704
MLNPYDEQQRLEVMLACCYKAVQAHFSHIAVRDIISPPHDLFDAALARQLAIYIFHVEFEVPRRRIVKMQARQRTSISFAIAKIDERLGCPVFAKAYARMAARAKDIFMQQLRKAAA